MALRRVIYAINNTKVYDFWQKNQKSLFKTYYIRLRN